MPVRSPEKVVIPRGVVKTVTPLLDMDLDTCYLALGQHLSQVQNPAHAMFSIQSVERSFGIKMPTIPADLATKAKEFLKEYWQNILKEGCDWWGKNKDKSAGATQISALAVAIAPALPPPFNALAGVLAIIAVILLRAGMDILCKNQPAQPPS